MRRIGSRQLAVSILRAELVSTNLRQSFRDVGKVVANFGQTFRDVGKLVMNLGQTFRDVEKLVMNFGQTFRMIHTTDVRHLPMAAVRL